MEEIMSKVKTCHSCEKPSVYELRYEWEGDTYIYLSCSKHIDLLERAIKLNEERIEDCSGGVKPRCFACSASPNHKLVVDNTEHVDNTYYACPEHIDRLIVAINTTPPIGFLRRR